MENRIIMLNKLNNQEEIEKTLDDFWKDYHLFEEAIRKMILDDFETFYKRNLPCFIHSIWLQNRMGMFTLGNLWEPRTNKNIFKDKEKFKIIQKNYLRIMGNEFSLNFNLSIAALFRKNSKSLKPNEKFISKLGITINGNADEKELNFKKKNDIAIFNISNEFYNSILPEKVFERLKELSYRNDLQYIPYDIQEELHHCRERTYYAFIRKWDAKSLINGRYDKVFTSLAIFLFTLEYINSKNRIENKWKDLLDIFNFKTDEDLFYHLLGVLQSIIFLMLLIEDTYKLVY